MNSIGNDVVALSLINPERTRQYRFYSKILSSAEQHYYSTLSQAPIPFEHYVWLLWSVKEAAYKFMKRLHPQLRFSPTQTVVQLAYWGSDESSALVFAGTVVIKEVHLQLQALVTTEYIHALVNATSEFTGVHWGVHYISETYYEAQSAAVRVFATAHLSICFPSAAITLHKHEAGYPVVEVNGSKAPAGLCLSLAHDGHYVAYAFVITATE